VAGGPDAAASARGGAVHIHPAIVDDGTAQTGTGLGRRGRLAARREDLGRAIALLMALLLLALRLELVLVLAGAVCALLAPARGRSLLAAEDRQRAGERQGAQEREQPASGVNSGEGLGQAVKPV